MKTTRLFKRCLVVVALLFCGVLSRSSFAQNQSCNIAVEALTESGNGIVEIPGPDGANAFALSTTVGAGGCNGFLSASARGVNLPPLNITLCQTNPQNAECIDGGPVSSLPVSFGQGAQPTFSVFVQASGTIPPGSSVCVNITTISTGSEGITKRTLICLPLETVNPT